ncbi:MAG: hypothetical protein JZU53_07065 [Paludibacter sp.]|nr:hypothetical protein [Paludibacter sp.]
MITVCYHQYTHFYDFKVSLNDNKSACIELPINQDKHFNVYQTIFSEEEYCRYASLMMSVNLVGDDSDNLSYEKELEELDAILDERCENWSSDNYLIKRTFEPTNPFALYVKDKETGVVVDVEGVFKTAFEACERGLQLECKIRIEVENKNDTISSLESWGFLKIGDRIFIGSEKEGSFAEVYAPEGIVDEAKSRARVMTASPRLLSVLKKVLKTIEAGIPIETSDEITEEIKYEIKQATLK